MGLGNMAALTSWRGVVGTEARLSRLKSDRSPGASREGKSSEAWL